MERAREPVRQFPRRKKKRSPGSIRSGTRTTVKTGIQIQKIRIKIRIKRRKIPSRSTWNWRLRKMTANMSHPTDLPMVLLMERTIRSILARIPTIIRQMRYKAAAVPDCSPMTGAIWSLCLTELTTRFRHLIRNWKKTDGALTLRNMVIRTDMF